MNSNNQHSADSEVYNIHRRYTQTNRELDECVCVCVAQGLMEELQVVRSERDKAVADQRTLQQSISSLEQEKQVLYHQQFQPQLNNSLSPRT